jgi:hypothetical protein
MRVEVYTCVGRRSSDPLLAHYLPFSLHQTIAQTPIFDQRKSAASYPNDTR